MKTVSEFIMNLKNKNIRQNSEELKVKNDGSWDRGSSDDNIEVEGNPNAPYCGDPYAYDWKNSRFKDLDWRRRWIG